MPKPIKNKWGTYISMEEIRSKECDSEDESQDIKKHAVRLIIFIPGKTLYAIRPWTTTHFYQVGKLLAQMTLALKVRFKGCYHTEICYIIMK